MVGFAGWGTGVTLHDPTHASYSQINAMLLV